MDNDSGDDGTDELKEFGWEEDDDDRERVTEEERVSIWGESTEIKFQR